MNPPAPSTDLAFWRMPLSDLLGKLAADPAGLSDAEAASRLASAGPNLIQGERKRSAILLFLGKFLNPLVIILLIASAVSGATGDRASFFVICAIVLMSVTLDFVQEYRARAAADRLRDSVAVRGKVLRGGKVQEVPLATVVPGDVVNLAAGDMIPADGRILEAKDLFINEALLTGEPYPVDHRQAPGLHPEPGEPTCWRWKGSSIGSTGISRRPDPPRGLRSGIIVERFGDHPRGRTGVPVCFEIPPCSESWKS